MKLSERTLTILRNFSVINPGIVLRPGNVLKTICPDDNIYAEAEIEETLPDKEMGIRDLSQFLANLAAMNDPDISYDGEKIIIKDTDGYKLVYLSSLVSLIKSPPTTGQVNTKNPDVGFDISKATLIKLLKFSNMNKFDTMYIAGNGKNLTATVSIKGNDLSNQVAIDIGEYEGSSFSTSFSIEHLKILPDDYHVELFKVFNGGTNKYSYFTSKDGKLKYFIGMEIK